MGSKDILYSWDVDTGEITSKTRFNDNGTVDKWLGINEKGYGHEKYSDANSYAKQESGDVYSRSVGEDPNRTWSDRDGVFEPEDNDELMVESTDYDTENIGDAEILDDGDEMPESDASDDIDETDSTDITDVTDAGEQCD